MTAANKTAPTNWHNANPLAPVNWQRGKNVS
jgi:hypothetical protein